jgi:uncharacterized membrane protein (UPF0127 family)
MKKILFLFLPLLLMGCQIHTDHDEKTPLHLEQTRTITVGNQTFSVEVATTSQERQRGLMFRESLEPGTGMFFIFEKEDFYGFWMKNTLIPLDIIWINADKKIVDIQTLQACTEKPCDSHIPSQKALYVLEVNAGEFEGKIGDTIKQ